MFPTLGEDTSVFKHSFVFGRVEKARGKKADGEKVVKILVLLRRVNAV